MGGRKYFYLFSLFSLINLFFIHPAHAERPARRVATDEPYAPPSNTLPTYAPNPGANPPVAHAERVEEFNGQTVQNWFGYEGPAVSTTSVFSEAAANFGGWFDKNWGFDLYVGYAKSADSAATTTNTSAAATTRTTTTSTTYSGTASPRAFLFGGSLKYRVYQTRYFGVSADFMLTLTPGTSVSYQSGSHTVTIPDTNTPTTYSTSDVSLGTVSRQTAAYFRMGPRLNADYNVPFVPNLVLGASVGIFMAFGGSTTTTSTLRSQSYQTLNGVDQTPTSDTTVTNTVVSDPGGSSNTYAIGGTGLNIGAGGLSPLAVVGTFRIRYAF